MFRATASNLPQRLLPFWFDGYKRGEIPSLEVRRKWFAPTPEIDAYFVENFYNDFEAYENEKVNMVSGPYTQTELDPLCNLSLTILGNYYPRALLRYQMVKNNGKATPDMMVQSWVGPRGQLFDNIVRETAYLGIQHVFPVQYDHVERAFFYLPMLRRETKLSQKIAVVRFNELHEEAPRYLRPYTETLVEYARNHLDVFTRFGRFPTRNAMLGRKNTAEEIEYLKTLTTNDPHNPWASNYKFIEFDTMMPTVLTSKLAEFFSSNSLREKK